MSKSLKRKTTAVAQKRESAIDASRPKPGLARVNLARVKQDTLSATRTAATINNLAPKLKAISQRIEILIGSSYNIYGRTRRTEDRLRKSEKQMPLARSSLGSPMAVIQGAFLRELAKFGDGFYELGVFKFDLRASGRS
jgi:hypothetical protein